MNNRQDARKKKNAYDNEYVRQNYKRISLNISKEQYERLKKFSEQLKMPVNAVLRQFIENELSHFKSKENDN